MEDFKKEINNNTLMVEAFNTPLPIMDRSSKQRINKDILVLNNTPGQIDLNEIYRTLYPKEQNYTFFSNAHGTFSKIDHMVIHKTSLNKFNKI